MDAEDQGHRYGNFPNYYSFHPPQNRLQVLEESSILNHIRNGLLLKKRTSTTNDELFVEKAVVGSDSAAVSKAIANNDGDESVKKKARIEIEDKSHHQHENIIYYCDLGCNEGDLTMAMASSLLTNNIISKETKDESTATASKSSSSDNNGDESKPTVKCLGLDLDPMLIGRAKTKFCTNTPTPTPQCSNSEEVKSEESSKAESKLEKEDMSNTSNECEVKAMFKECNLCVQSEHNNAYTSFLNDTIMGNNNSEGATTTANKESKPQALFHLTTIFSTTMWIHVHGGDEGLRMFLERACAWTKRYLLIEPQPSGCYRKANVRLRKMGRQEIKDVTSSRLQMRPDIEKQIESVVTRCGFRKVELDEMTKGSSDDKERHQDAITSWKRTLHLYERV